MVGTSDIKTMADFYEKMFDRKADMIDDNFFGWTVGKTFFGVSAHSEVKGKSSEPQRIMFNFETAEVKEEFLRMKEAGAIVVKEPYEMGEAWIATLEDPDGNYFQLMTPWEG